MDLALRVCEAKIFSLRSEGGNSTCTTNSASTPHFQTENSSVDGNEKSDNFFAHKSLLYFSAKLSLRSRKETSATIQRHFKRFYTAPLPPTHPYTEACRRRDNISFRVLLKTYQQFLSLTPNQAGGTRSTSYGLLFPPGLPLLSCPAAGPKTGGKEEKTYPIQAPLTGTFPKSFCFPPAKLVVHLKGERGGSERSIKSGSVEAYRLELEGASGWRQAGWGVSRWCVGAQRGGVGGREPESRGRLVRDRTAVPKLRDRDR